MASKLYEVDATIVIFVLVLYCTGVAWWWSVVGWCGWVVCCGWVVWLGGVVGWWSVAR